MSSKNDEIQGNAVKKGRPKAIQVGGPLGVILPYDSLQPGSDDKGLSGPDLSSEDVQVLYDGDCIVSTVRQRLGSVLDKGEGLCARCRMALGHMDGILALIVSGGAGTETLDELMSFSRSSETGFDCGVAKEAMTPLGSSLRFFFSEFEMHAKNKHCPARACPKLLPAPCQLACPAGIDIPSYLALLAHGRYAEALEVIRQDNPFAWVCGLICPHPCEKACVRSHLDDPINIRYLKAFVSEWTTEQHGYPSTRVHDSNGHKVAVIGSGPAGLSAAYYLAMAGYAVTIFESLPMAGGLLMVGIPEYRLPRRIVQREIDAVRSMGVEIKTGVAVGKDIALDELRSQGFKAFFLAIGAHHGYKLNIPGEEEFPQIRDAIGFLKEVNLGNRKKPADKVVVVGGGNSAMDAARTCVRLGCDEVHVAYRRTREQMPANPQEVEEAVEEGVRFHFLAVPVKVGGKDGHPAYLECLRAELGKPDASGRRRPIPKEGSNFRIEAGAIIAAIGQQPDLGSFSDKIDFEITPRNLIVTEPFSTRTSLKDVFAGGDAVTGPATVVEAIAAGKQAALDINHYLTGSTEAAPIFRVHKRRKVPFLNIPASDKISIHRAPVPLVHPDRRRRSFEPVELGYSEETAQKEARRCLRCDVCIRCGACEAVCRDDMKVHALDFSRISSTERILSNYERPKERCIACGACAIACPTDAIEFVETPTKREVRLCGTILNQLEVDRCDRCGAPFVPPRYLEYVVGRGDTVMEKLMLPRLCPECSRQRGAQLFVKF